VPYAFRTSDGHGGGGGDQVDSDFVFSMKIIRVDQTMQTYYAVHFLQFHRFLYGSSTYILPVDSRRGSFVFSLCPIALSTAGRRFMDGLPRVRDSRAGGLRIGSETSPSLSTVAGARALPLPPSQALVLLQVHHLTQRLISLSFSL
jgi:hypothetical protein